MNKNPIKVVLARRKAYTMGAGKDKVDVAEAYFVRQIKNSLFVETSVKEDGTRFRSINEHLKFSVDDMLTVAQADDIATRYDSTIVSVD